MYAIRSYYDDVRNPDLRQFEDAVSIIESTTLINRYIERETESGIPAGKIIIAGFSQGGAITLRNNFV